RRLAALPHRQPDVRRDRQLTSAQLRRESMHRRPGAASLLVTILLAAGCASGAARPGAADGAPYDVVILNGRIVDGTGAAWYYGDLAIRGDRIARIAPRGVLRDAPARERVD